MPASTVSDFQRDIVAVAKAESREVGGLSPLPHILSLTGFFAGAFYTFEWFGDPWYHVLGFAMALGAVAVVRYVIDPGIVSCSWDKRFTEYRLSSYFQYEKVFLRKGVGRWMLNVKAVAKILFSGVLPPYGISILVMVPFEYLESRKTIRIMKKSYQVGEEVGLMINAGRTEDEVRDYLSARITAKNRMTGKTLSRETAQSGATKGEER
jgi:hypothetical protein